MKNPFLILVGSMILLSVFACKQDETETGETPIATVYNQVLYPSDIKGLVTPYTSKEDSAQIVKDYIENWAKNILMQRIAEENIQNKEAIKKKVKAYEASLVQYEYEKALASQRLDTVINDAEVLEYYQKTKPQHILKNKVVQCYFLRVPVNSVDLTDVKKWWKTPSDNREELADFAEKGNFLYFLDDSLWLHTDFVAAQFPNNSFNQSNLQKGYNLTTEKEGFHYFLKVNKTLSKGATAPMSYIKEKAVNYILHQRKLKLLDETANEIYQRELNKNNVKIGHLDH